MIWPLPRASDLAAFNCRGVAIRQRAGRLDGVCGRGVGASDATPRSAVEGVEWGAALISGGRPSGDESARAAALARALRAVWVRRAAGSPAADTVDPAGALRGCGARAPALSGALPGVQ